MMQEVARRHFDAAAVDRQMMMGMVNHLTQAVYAQQNRDEPMPQAEVNLTYMQQMHQQTMNLVQNNHEVLAQFMNHHAGVTAEQVIRLIYEDVLRRHGFQGFGPPPPPPEGAVPIEVVRPAAQRRIANQEWDFTNVFAKAPPAKAAPSAAASASAAPPAKARPSAAASAGPGAGPTPKARARSSGPMPRQPAAEAAPATGPVPRHGAGPTPRNPTATRGRNPRE